jgi:hypothetical protein
VAKKNHPYLHLPILLLVQFYRLDNEYKNYQASVGKDNDSGWEGGTTMKLTIILMG